MTPATTPARPPEAATDHETDFHGWALAQAALLSERRFDELDLTNLVDEVEDMARRQADELRSRYSTIVLHLLKWQHQPERRTHGWAGTIERERSEVAILLEDNRSLRPKRADQLRRAWQPARSGAAAETGLSVRTFPATCPYDVDQVMDEAFWPGPPWPGFEAADRAAG